MTKPRKRALRHKPGRLANVSGDTPTQPERGERRKALKRLRTGALLVAGLGGGSFYVGSGLLASIDEADLSKIGNGIPTIVQMHDPQCPSCRALQREARQALAQFREGELQYLVADIRKDDGRVFAASHRVQHVTLLLLDGEARRTQVITGPIKSAALESAFRLHLVGRSGPD